MKLVINGTTYDGQLQPFIGDLRLLKRTLGFGWGTVAERMQKIAPDADALALLDDEEFIDALLAWIWMTRLRSGERDLTFEQVAMTPVDQIQMLHDDPSAAQTAAADADDADPTSAQTASGLGDAKPERKRASTKASSKTSNLRSISA